MSDSNEIFALVCPNCKAPLSCKSTDMTTICEHCGTSVFIKELVTADRINKSDKLKSNLAMADNSINNRDWKSAYKYYESICKVEPSSENMAIFNLLSYICGKLDYQASYFEESKNISLDKRKVLLEASKKSTVDEKTKKIQDVYKKYRNQKVARKQAKLIDNQYTVRLNLISLEIQKASPVKCSCGNTVECTEQSCSKCGKSRDTILTEYKDKLAKSKSNNINLIVALICGGLGIFFGAGTFSEILYGDFSFITLFLALFGIAIMVYIINVKVKDMFLDLLPDKLRTNEYMPKALLVATIIIPIVFMLLLGSCMKPQENEEKNESSIVVTTTQKITEKATTKAAETIKIPKHGTSEYVDYLTLKAKSDAETVSDKEIDKAETWLKDNVENIFDNEENMENTMYYGALIEYKYKNKDTDKSKLGFQAAKTVKYVYRGAEKVSDEVTKDNWNELREMLGIPVETTETEETEIIETEVVEEVAEEEIIEEAEPEEVVEEVEADPNDSIYVYRTPTGSKYHYDGTCNGGTYYECTLSEALSRGLEPCGKCVN